MNTKTRNELPAPLESVRRRFLRWRQSRQVGTRIPEALWDAAAKMAHAHGLNRTAKTLGLDYYSLKQRADAQNDNAAAENNDGPSQNVAPFWELTPPSLLSSTSECTLEWEDPQGAKMRVHIKGAAPDLAALSRSFWRIPS